MSQRTSLRRLHHTNGQQSVWTPASTRDQQSTTKFDRGQSEGNLHLRLNDPEGIVRTDSYTLESYPRTDRHSLGEDPLGV